MIQRDLIAPVHCLKDGSDLVIAIVTPTKNLEV
jgi:hypothetical protein